jgi:hypothetical protein
MLFDVYSIWQSSISVSIGTLVLHMPMLQFTLCGSSLVDTSLTPVHCTVLVLLNEILLQLIINKYHPKYV